MQQIPLPPLPDPKSTGVGGPVRHASGPPNTQLVTPSGSPEEIEQVMNYLWAMKQHLGWYASFCHPWEKSIVQSSSGPCLEFSVFLLIERGVAAKRMQIDN